MRTVPRTKAEQIRFFKTRLAKWAEDPQAIGTTAEIVAQLAAEVAAAEADYREQQQLESTAQSATLRSNTSLAKVLNTGASIISQVRSKARLDGAGIYGLASLTPPQPASPIGEPGTPTGFWAKLLPNGSLVLTWKCDNPRGAVGTVYQVYRMLGRSSGAKFEFLGVVGEKKFVDETVPRGTSDLIYKVNGLRSTTAGLAAEFPVNLAGPGRRATPFQMKTRKLTSAHPINAAA